MTIFDPKFKVHNFFPGYLIVTMMTKIYCISQRMSIKDYVFYVDNCICGAYIYIPICDHQHSFATRIANYRILRCGAQGQYGYRVLICRPQKVKRGILKLLIFLPSNCSFLISGQQRLLTNWLNHSTKFLSHTGPPGFEIYSSDMPLTLLFYKITY